MIGAADLLAELECQAQSRTSVWSAEKHLKMPAAFIEQVSRIRCLGVFQDSANSGATNFKRWNLIYGFNGTGKTTLSRVFASIGDGKLHNALPQTGSFLLKLSDGSQIDSGDLEGNPLSRKLFVFNTDFVEANLRWETGTPTPIFYIGQHQAEAASQLAQKRAALQRLGDIEAQWTQTRIVADRELATLKRTAARTISEVLGLGRRYEAPELTADFENEQFRTGGVLSADDLANARRIATTEEHLPRLPLLALDVSFQ